MGPDWKWQDLGAIRSGLYYSLWDGRNWYMGANAMGGLSGTVTVLSPPFPNPLSAIVRGQRPRLT